jgi:glutamate-1-semialdehyde 2,1-aminomutase
MALEKFVNAYVARTPRSRAIYEDARNYLPGGVSGNAKFLKPYPLYVKSARGSHVTDVDGNDYVDLLDAVGAAILGHGHESIRRAVKEQIDEAILPLMATELEVKLAKQVSRLMDYMEMLRFVNSGSEATLMAMRAARAFTGRERIAKFEGNYHGQHDWSLIGGAQGGQGPESEPLSAPDCAGIPRSVVDNVLMLPYNDMAAIDLVRRHARELAAVIIEPVAAFFTGAVPADVEFLRALRKVTEDHGVMLIFDEIVTGFRLGLGGAAAHYGVRPDLGCIGKIVGGGFPVGAFGGRRDLMEQVITPTKQPSDAKEKSFASGTFSGNPISMAAGLAALAELERNPVYEYVGAMGHAVREGLTASARRAGFPVQVTGVGSLFHVHFADEPITSKRSAMRANHARQYEFSMGLLSKGILLTPHHPGFLSAAHTAEDVREVLRVADEVLREMAAG